MNISIIEYNIEVTENSVILTQGKNKILTSESQLTGDNDE